MGYMRGMKTANETELEAWYGHICSMVFRGCAMWHANTVVREVMGSSAADLL